MRRRPVIPAICAVMLLVVGQLVAFAHEAEQRHVTCTEHGEQLDAVELAEALHECEHDHLIAVDGDHGGEHDDCAIARALRQSSATPECWSPPPATAVMIEITAPAVRVVATASSLYRLAPKTSPPV